jgi:dUTP pyrophosphatase
MVVTKVPTGLYMAIPEGYYGQIFDRSSMGSKGKHVFGGVLDSSYRGNVMVCLYNSGAPYWVKKGDRIAQLVILPVPEVKWEVVDKLDNSERGENGFGSSGQ